MAKPLAIDLCCGLGGWTEGLLLEGWDVIGYDIERHKYGSHQYPAQLVLQDILTLDGRQFRGKVSLIVASPTCQRYSYMAMPWTRAKDLIAWHRDHRHPERIVELNALFDACVRIGREAGCPILIENVRGAVPWVGRSRWHYGSYHLWGDVPALMPITIRRDAVKVETMGASDLRHVLGLAFNTHAERQTRAVEDDGVKGFTPDGQPLGKNVFARKHGSKSSARKAASARIAKIPLPLARWIARCYYPRE